MLYDPRYPTLNFTMAFYHHYFQSNHFNPVHSSSQDYMVISTEQPLTTRVSGYATPLSIVALS